MDKRYYEEKIKNATPMGLVIITYEMLLETLEKASKEIETNSETAREAIIHAQAILRSLTSGLNLDYDISTELLDIYMYISSILIDCQIKANRANSEGFVKENIAHVSELLNSLLEGIKAVPDTDAPIIETSSKIHAGMTYGKDGNLSEYIHEDISKTYKA